MFIRNKIAEAMETTTRAMRIQATRVDLMELVMNETILDISKHIAIINIGMNKKILTELVIIATSWDIIKKIAARNKGTNNKISQRTKNHQNLF